MQDLVAKCRTSWLWINLAKERLASRKGAEKLASRGEGGGAIEQCEHKQFAKIQLALCERAHCIERFFLLTMAYWGTGGGDNEASHHWLCALG
jgi:hypothetical protein